VALFPGRLRVFGIALLLAIITAVGTIRRASGDPAIRALALAVAVVLAIGTFFYWSVEGWSLLDSLYFTVVALSTVGFGDFAPETTFGKLFTILYIFIGVALIMGFATAIVQRSRLWVRLEEREAEAKGGAGRSAAGSSSVPNPHAPYSGEGEV
jgi:voltage-gated potassium channel